MHGDRIGASVPRQVPSSQNGAARLSIATSADHRAGDTRDRILRVPLAIIDHEPATISPPACRSPQFGNGPKPSNSPCTRPPAALFFFRLAPYIGGAGSPAMEINDRRNKPFGPGGSTRRLHQSLRDRKVCGLWRGRNRIDEGVKGDLLPGIVPPLSGCSVVANDNYAPVALAA